MWNFFVLDFDGTYDNEGEGMGVTPLVFLVPDEDMLCVEKLAQNAGKDFWEITDDRTIGDLFSDYLTKEHIPYHIVGDIKLPFKERQKDYLLESIHRCVV